MLSAVIYAILFSDLKVPYMTYPEYYTPGFLFSWSIISP
nr:MAG TPA: hypothetical protein [Bacteriophage sp.]